MRSESLSSVWITTAVSLSVLAVCVLGESAALAQEAACGTIESDPATWPDPSQFPPLPDSCYGPNGPVPNVCTDNGCILDVLVIYTPAARIAALASGTTINAVIDAAVFRMNQAFVNSLIPSFVRLVGTAEVPYVEPDGEDLCATYNSCWIEALECVSDSSCMPLAHVLRNELKADIVSLFVDPIWGGPVAGLARPDTPNFNVVRWNKAALDGTWAFAHETGHNLGADHEGLNYPGKCHAYLHYEGGVFAWGTIMRRYGQGNIQHYSNPYVSYLGVPTGTAASADNASCIRLYAPGTAGRGDAPISDCNLNGICDAYEIANCPPGDPTCQDCEHNGIPDGGIAENGYTWACCLDGTCADKTELCCLYQGGMFKGGHCGEDCNQNAVDDACESPGACCGPAPYYYCSVIPEDCCMASGGTFQGPGARCSGDEGNSVCWSGPSYLLGACCYSGMLCGVYLESTCASYGGTFGGAGTYCEDCNGNGWPAPCEGPTTREYGACCNGEGACIIATECSCHGQFLGVGSVCGALTGACCLGTACMIASQTSCSCQGGAFLGAGTTCAGPDCNCNTIPDSCDIAGGTSPESNENGVPDECESPRACCPPQGSCDVISACSCAQAGGTVLSQQTFCETTQRACCRPPPYEDCVVTTLPCCYAVGGTFWDFKLKCKAVQCPSYNGPSQGP